MTDEVSLLSDESAEESSLACACEGVEGADWEGEASGAGPGEEGLGPGESGCDDG